jgi:membrane-associated protease RseP (regulator of RpoE activity)
MTTAVKPRREGDALRETRARRPHRVERWRWFVALAIAGAAITAGVGYLVGVWLAALLIVGAHEAGHAVAARRLRIPTSIMVIGVGPRVARFVVRGLPIEIRSVPVLGWVEMDRDRVPVGSPRVAAVYAAGPAASLLLSVAVLLGAFASFQGPSNVGLADARYSVRTTADAAQGMWAAPFRPVLQSVRSSPPEPGGEAASSAGTTGESTETAAEGESEAEVSSIIGITAATPRNVETHGAGWIFMAVAALSASVAGLNLLPAWGLDGHGILEEMAGTILRRNPTWGRRARRAVAAAGVVTASLLLWLLVTALIGDIVALV